ncbi:MAG: hypothetical protein KGP28_11995 [Bdellovibrionales bacterium]|nr:hypothetical protein [Bdellovibrionales bacterium]
MSKRSKESGQAVVEYIILLSITLGIVVAFARNMTSIFDKGAPKIGGKFERQIRAGAAPAGLWRE